MTTGAREDCKWLQKRMEERFEIKTKVIGDLDEEHKEERIFNRIIRRTLKGWEMEADQRHVDNIIDQLNLKNAKSVKTP